MNEVIKNISWKQGTSRLSRLSPNLSTADLHLMENSLISDINLVNEYASLFYFYNRENKPEGTWRPFFEKDELFILASIIKTDMSGIHAEFDRIDNRLYLIQKYPEKKIPLLQEIYKLSIALVSQVSGWYEALDARALRKGMLSEIRDAINNTMRPKLDKLQEYRDWCLRQGIVTPEMASELDMLPSIWSRRGDDCSHTTEINDFSQLLRGTFHDYLNTTRYLVQLAPRYFQESLEISQEHDPQVSLMITFLQLLQHARGELNEIPQKHLDYYYRHILQEQELNTDPGEAMVAFELAAGAQGAAIDAGTRLLAGKDATGADLIYTTRDSLIVTPVTIREIRQLYLSREGEQAFRRKPQGNTGAYTDSYTALNLLPPVCQMYSAAFDPAEQPDGWFTIGREQSFLPADEQEMQVSTFGLYIASSLFYTSACRRKFTVRFSIEQIQEQFEIDTLDAAFDLALSGEEDWFTISAYEGRLSADYFEIWFTLTDEDPAIPFEAPYAAPDANNWPVLRIDLRTDARNSVYEFVKQFSITAVDISLEVEGLQELSLFNEEGPMPANQAFPLFGSFPSINSYLHIGSGEVFHKQIDELSLELRWANLPGFKRGLEEYYQDYPQPWDNHSFQIEVSFLKNGLWEPSREFRKQFHLFPGEGGDQSGPLSKVSVIDGLEINEVELPHQNTITDTNEFANTLKRGFMRIDLVKPALAFGHQEYPNLISEITVYNNTPKLMRRKVDKVPEYIPKTEEEMKPIPREPFTPEVETLRLNYKASVSCRFPDRDQSQICLYHRYPSGFYSSHETKERSMPFMVDFDNLRGSFYLGLENLKPSETLSLHFEMREKAGDLTTASTQQPSWYYLAENNWHMLRPDKEIIFDQTGGMKYSGIIKLELPANMGVGNHIMPGHLHWLKVSLPYGCFYAERIKAITINAATCAWEPQYEGQEHPDMPLPPGSIAALETPNPALATISQPYAPLDHYYKENQHAFLNRVSERLRHKNRAINEWDYEHLLLQRFPYLSHVICFPAIRMEMQNDLPVARTAPGELMLVVMQQSKQKGDVNVHDMLVSHSDLYRIKEYLSTVSPGFTQINVTNPPFEWIEVKTSILFEPGYTSGYYLGLLNEEINDYYAPWLKDHSKPLALGGSLLKADLIAFIESRHYVRHLKKIQMRLLNEVGVEIENDEDHTLTSTTPWSLLVPKARHLITAMTDEVEPQNEEEGVLPQQEQ